VALLQLSFAPLAQTSSYATGDSRNHILLVSLEASPGKTVIKEKRMTVNINS